MMLRGEAPGKLLPAAKNPKRNAQCDANCTELKRRQEIARDLDDVWRAKTKKRAPAKDRLLGMKLAGAHSQGRSSHQNVRLRANSRAISKMTRNRFLQNEPEDFIL
jgi:hypothetical protein